MWSEGLKRRIVSPCIPRSLRSQGTVNHPLKPVTAEGRSLVQKSLYTISSIKSTKRRINMEEKFPHCFQGKPQSVEPKLIFTDTEQLVKERLEGPEVPLKPK